MTFHKVHMILPCGLLALSLMTLALPTNVSATVCHNNSQCDDGLFCNGLELCRPADPLALPNGCVEWIEPPGVNGRFTGRGGSQEVSVARTTIPTPATIAMKKKIYVGMPLKT